MNLLRRVLQRLPHSLHNEEISDGKVDVSSSDTVSVSQEQSGMSIDSEMRTVLRFVECNKGRGIESTGARKVDYAGHYLYNVIGSTDDPKRIPGHHHKSWKKLLTDYGIDGECYVHYDEINDWHPHFNVGGHMTPHKDGSVRAGGICYLMPLCYWHNKQDGVSFKLKEHSMLELTGYREGELAATFLLRLPSQDPYALLYRTEEGWSFENLSNIKAKNFKPALLQPMGIGHVLDYVLFERVHADRTLYYIRETSLPSASALDSST